MSASKTYYHVTMLTKRAAEKHTRHAYNVPPHVGLGWKPYTYLVLEHGHTSIAAFYDGASLKRWLAAHGVVLGPISRRAGEGIATGWAHGLTVGQRVTFNGGFPGTVVALPMWAPGMVEVRGERGSVCIPVGDCKPLS